MRRRGDDPRDSAPTLIRDPQAGAPTLIDEAPRLPSAPVLPKPSIAMISMKTPGEVDAPEEPPPMPLPAVRIRAISEVGARTPARGVGRLAPPRDARAARSRRLSDYAKWSLVMLAIAAVVTVVVWLLARSAA